MIAAGTGILPMILWIEYVMLFAPNKDHQSDYRVTLFVQESTLDGIVLRSKLDQWQNRFPTRIKIIYFIHQNPVIVEPGFFDTNAIIFESISPKHIHEHMPYPLHQLSAPEAVSLDVVGSFGRERKLGSSIPSKKMTSSFSYHKVNRGYMQRKSSMVYTPLLMNDSVESRKLLQGNSNDSTMPSTRSPLHLQPILNFEEVVESQDKEEEGKVDPKEFEINESPPPFSSKLFVCGPSGFASKINEILLEMGYPTSQIMILD
jgi:ferredoxin-NADP reductase